MHGAVHNTNSPQLLHTLIGPLRSIKTLHLLAHEIITTLQYTMCFLHVFACTRVTNNIGHTLFVLEVLDWNMH
jgi:hypothetical protein